MSIGVIEIAVKLLRQLKAVKGEHIRTSVGDIKEQFGTLIKSSGNVGRKRWRDGTVRGGGIKIL